MYAVKVSNATISSFDLFNEEVGLNCMDELIWV